MPLVLPVASSRCTLTAGRLLLVSFVLWLSSCTTVSSIYPLLEKKEASLFRPELLGTWEEDGTYRVVQKGEDSLYRIMVITTARDSLPLKDTSYFTGRLALLDGYLFMDVVVDGDAPSWQRIGQYSRAAIRPMHYFYRVVLRNKKEVIELWELDADHLGTILAERKIAFYEDEDRSIIVAEGTAGLRKLLPALVKEPSAWKKSYLLRSGPPPALAQHTPD